MAIKQMLSVIIFFIFTNNFTSLIAETSQQKNFVFNRGMHTKINGNSIFDYIYLNREQLDGDSVFKYTRVVEFGKDKKLTEAGTLESFEKTYRSSVYGLKNPVDRFEKYATMNNAIYCSDVEQLRDCDGNVQDVGAIIYGAQYLELCSSIREYLRHQKRAEENSKSQVGVAGNKSK